MHDLGPRTWDPESRKQDLRAEIPYPGPWIQDQRLRAKNIGHYIWHCSDILHEWFLSYGNTHDKLILILLSSNKNFFHKDIGFDSMDSKYPTLAKLICSQWDGIDTELSHSFSKEELWRYSYSSLKIVLKNDEKIACPILVNLQTVLLSYFQLIIVN